MALGTLTEQVTEKKLNPTFPLKNEKKLIIHLSRSFLNYSSRSLATNQPHRPFTPKVALNTKTNLTPKVTPKT